MEKREVEQIGIAVKCQKCRKLLMVPLSTSIEKFRPERPEDRRFPKFCIILDPHQCAEDPEEDLAFSDDTMLIQIRNVAPPPQG